MIPLRYCPLIILLLFSYSCDKSLEKEKKKTKKVEKVKSIKKNKVATDKILLPTFIVTLKKENRKFAKVSLVLEVSQGYDKKELKDKYEMIMDSIKDIVKFKKVPDLKRKDNKINIKKELLTRINDILTRGNVVNIIILQLKVM